MHYQVANWNLTEGTDRDLQDTRLKSPGAHDLPVTCVQSYQLDRSIPVRFSRHHTNEGRASAVRDQPVEVKFGGDLIGKASGSSFEPPCSAR
jgi:hypothetical protein